MRKALLFSVSLLIYFSTIAQQQSFDLLTFTPPAGWKKEVKQNLVTFTSTDDASQTWCVIGVIKSTTSKGNIDADLLSEWNELVVKQYNADSMQATETERSGGLEGESCFRKFYHNNESACGCSANYIQRL